MQSKVSIAASMTESSPPIQHLGRYDIVRVLGQGAMGVVYEGRDPNLDRRVAIKTVRVVGMAANEVAEYEQRFNTEARSAGRLQHPNIVSVYDSDTHVDSYGKTAYIVMEFVKGEDLKHFLDQGKRFSLEQTACMMSDLLAALDYAHRNKIIHRDIKPANMLLTREGHIKLTDFGVARITDSGEATKTSGGTVGTLKYMSPEQVAGKDVDASSDLFSAGIVLYQLLTGVRPFDGEGYLDIVSKIVKEDAVPPSRIMGALPPSLDAVVAKALAKSKLDRFADAASFAAALKSAVSNADLTITPSAQTRQELMEGMSTFPGSSSGGSTVPQELELVYWKDIKESNEQDVLEGFLRRFPAGIYADLAKRKLKNLVENQRTIGVASHYETTVLRKLSEPTKTSSPVVPVATEISGVVSTATAQGNGLPMRATDNPTLPPSAFNDSTYGPSTQFAQTQFPMTEPSALSRTAERSAANSGGIKRKSKLKHMSLPLETAPVQLPPSARKNKSRAPWGLISIAVMAISAGLFWLTPNADIAPTATQAAAVSITRTSSDTASASSSTTVSVAASLSADETSTTATSATVTISASSVASPTFTADVPLPLPLLDASGVIGETRTVSTPRAFIPTKRASAPAASNPSLPASASVPDTSPPVPLAPPPPLPRASLPAPITAAAARSPAGPREACSDRILLGFLSCMADQCERPVFRNHPACIERREMEERRRASQ